MNQNSPEPYVQFRFEDSLRKYEPPVRKRIKNSLEKCSHCLRNYSQMRNKSQISRIYDSQSNYLGLSGGNSAALSKQKDQKKDMEKRQISDFVDDTIATRQFEQGFEWDKIEIKGKDSEIFENYELFKEKVLDDMKAEKKVIRKKAMMEMKKKYWNPFYDVDLEIQIIEGMRNQLQKDLIHILSKELFCENQKEKNQNQIKIQQIHAQNQNSSHDEPQFTTNHEPQDLFEKNSFLKENILFNGGRIKLEEEKYGKCIYLSTRILTMAVQTAAIDKLKKRHPEFEKIVEAVSKIIENEKLQKKK